MLRFILSEHCLPSLFVMLSDCKYGFHFALRIKPMCCSDWSVRKRNFVLSAATRNKQIKKKMSQPS